MVLHCLSWFLFLWIHLVSAGSDFFGSCTFVLSFISPVLASNLVLNSLVLDDFMGSGLSG